MCKKFVKNMLDSAIFGNLFSFFALTSLKLKESDNNHEHFFYILTPQIKDKC